MLYFFLYFFLLNILHQSFRAHFCVCVQRFQCVFFFLQLKADNLRQPCSAALSEWTVMVFLPRCLIQ